MLAGIRDILVISTPQDTPRFEQLLGDGSQWGMNLQLRRAAQPRRPGAGLHHRASTSSAARPSALVLGDNIFSRPRLPALLGNARHAARAPPCLPTTCTTPSATAWSSSTQQGGAVSIEEKPKPQEQLRRHRPVLLRQQVVRHRQGLKPSARGELEITDLNACTCARPAQVEIMGRGYAWLDTGTHDSLLEAGQFIATLEKRQGLKVACPEEIAWRSGWIDAAQLEALAQPLAKNGYGIRLLKEVAARQRYPMC
jgi:glucose-1-phosphate thymidylyltransferase